MTSHATDSLRRRAILAGVRLVLEKPFLNGALVDGIHDLLGHRAVDPAGYVESRRT